jgi:hypothetical protein
MKILKTLLLIQGGNTFFHMDTIEHQGRFWLVPEWIEAPVEGWRMPKRIICLENLQRQKLNPKAGYGDFSLSAPIPKAVLDGHDPQPLKGGYVVVERPDIRFPMPPSVQ